MNKEQQLKELSIIVSKYHLGCNLKIECNSECEKCCATAIHNAGYRKTNKPNVH